MVSPRLLSTSALAAALAVATPLKAQALQGTPSVAFGSVSIASEAGFDMITVSSPTAVIDWTPTDTSAGTAPIDFLPQGAIATFNSDVAPDYIVLNRILPTAAATGRPVAFNGTVVSQGFDPASQQATPGGSIWFYSPGGIFVGSTGVFDVGNLLLTANDIAVGANGLPAGPSVSLSMSAAANSRAKVEIASGAQLRSSLPGSYIALIAPRVVQSGTVSLDGTAAYVAAEAATVQINAGLFDIDITSGSFVDASIAGDGQTLRHDGQTLTAPGRQILMAAMPKNDAITMLVTGTLGYDPASTATVAGDAIVLSAGADIVANGPAQSFDSSLGADIVIGPGLYGPALIARAGRNVTASGTMAFGSDVSLFGRGQATMTALAGQTIDIGGSLRLAAQSIASTGTLLGGQARLQADSGATVSIGGNLQIDASASLIPYDSLPSSPQPPITGPAGTDAVGGTASLVATGSIVAVNGSIEVSADAVGTDGGTGELGGKGTGGTARIALTASTLTSGGAVTVGARGRGGVGLAGGDGRGGIADFTSDGSVFGPSTTLAIYAYGEGGGAQTNGTGGNGIGGNAGLTLSDSDPATGPTSPSLDAQTILIDAGGFGGSHYCGFFCTGLPSSGGDGRGGTASLVQSAGDIRTGFLLATADGFGGDGTDDTQDVGGNGGRGGRGIGGAVILQQSGGTISRNASFLSLNFSADGLGGFGGNAAQGQIPTPSGNGGDGGDGVAGSFTASIGGGIAADSMSFSARASGGSGGFSQDGIGGNGGAAAPGATASSAVSIGSTGNVALGTLSLDSRASGGDGGDDDLSTVHASGGSARGGNAALGIAGTFTADLLDLNASASGGNGGRGFEIPTTGPAGDSIGGSTTLNQTGGTSTIGSLFVHAFGTVGRGGATSAGVARGGTARVSLTGGALSVTGDMEIDASGSGFGVEVAGSGSAFGGDASFLAQNGASFSFGGQTLFVRAEGAGSGLPDSPSGSGTGGSASFGVDNADVTLGSSLIVSADGLAPAIDTLATGNGAGGTASLFALGGGSLTVSAPVRVSADGIGGSRPTDGTGTGNGGAGVGGNAMIAATGGTLSLAGATVSADGIGGAAGALGAGGTAQGGTASAMSELGGTLNITGLILRADATGGSSNLVEPPATSVGTFAGTGGNATGGTARIDANGGTVSLQGSSLVSALGKGGDAYHGGTGGAGNGGTVALATTLAGASLTGGNLTLDASGLGGAALENAGDVAGGGIAGAGTGGTATLGINSGLVDLGSMVIRIDGAGSTSTGGALSFTTRPGATVRLATLGVTATGDSGGALVFDVDGSSVDTADGISVDGEGEISVQATGSGGLVSGGPISLSTRSGITLAHAGGSVATLSGTSITLIAGSTINGSAGGRIDSGGDVILTAPGAVSMADVRTTGAVDASGSTLALGSGQSFAIRNAVATAGDVSLSSNGTLSIDGNVLGNTISLDATGIAISAASTVGDEATQSISITNRAGTTRIGDGLTGTGFLLDAAAFSRLQAHDIRIAGPGDVLVGQLSVIGSQGTGRRNLTGSTLELASGGTLLVSGALSLVDAGATDTLKLSAANVVRVVAGSGSIAVVDANGGLGGVFDIAAPRVAVTSDAAETALATLATTDERNTRLGQNDGPERPDGDVRANMIMVHAGTALHIQNSGGNLDAASRSGFVAGDGGFRLSVASSGTVPEVIINGRIGAATGNDVTQALTIVNLNGQPSTRIVARSAANGCVILSPNCGTADGITLPVQDLIDEVILEEAEAQARGTGPELAVPLIEIPDFDPLDFVPLIDEPVTGTGNEGLWVGES